MPDPIPPLLRPYVSPARAGSLTLVTSVLDATSNWLLLRFVHAALESQVINSPAGQVPALPDEPGDCKVIFVSLLRGFEQWREMGKKVGVDVASLIARERLVYINGLTTPVFSISSAPKESKIVNVDTTKIENLEIAIRRHTGQGKLTRNILIIDGLDFLLACQPSVTSQILLRTVMTLRSHVHNTVLTCSADSPLLHSPESTATPLESEHRAFVSTVAHQSRLVVQLRSLGTGAARDISGVVRVSAGGAGVGGEEGVDDIEEGEWLYQVKGDGSVKVWGRGE